MCIRDRQATSTWRGDLKSGAGVVSSESGALNDVKLNFVSRFENGGGSNPEELIAAAHAGCFSMALANGLSGDGHVPDYVTTKATVTLRTGAGGPTVTKIHLETEAKVPGIDAAAGFAFLVRFGMDWPDAVSAVGAAFGDVDGDGRDELGVITDTTESDRIHVFDDAPAGFAPLWVGDATWGAASVATGIAFGDVDGDGFDELAVTRKHDINARLFLYDDAAPSTVQAFGPLWQYGEGWGPGSYATGVAFGNVDDDPAEEIGLTRRATLNERAYVFDDAATGFATLQTFGESWAANAWPTAIAFGDVDSDGRDEVALSRVATINARVSVHDDAAPGNGRPAFRLLWDGGAEWPGEMYATTVAFGNVDANPEMELGLGRFAAEGPRAYVLGRGWAVGLPYVSDGRMLTADR